MHTVIRNKETTRDEFIFYSNRLMRLLIEYALSLLPFEDVCVKTTLGYEYEGKRHANAKVLKLKKRNLKFKQITSCFKHRFVVFLF